MKRIIYYHQMIQHTDYDPKTGEMIEVDEPERVDMQVSSDNDKNFEEQLATVKGYCDDWRIEEINETIEDLEAWFVWYDRQVIKYLMKREKALSDNDMAELNREADEKSVKLRVARNPMK